jgi:hypothetical protein
MARVFTRQEFYDLVWSRPMTHLAKEFGLSDVPLHKICRKHDVPNPPLGWWAKKAAGQLVELTPLPSPKSGTSERISIAGADVSREPNGLAAVREKARIIASSDSHDPDYSNPVVERTIAKLTKGKPSITGLVNVEGKSLIHCDVAPESVERLALILSRLASASSRQGFALESGENNAHFANGTETICLSISEEVKREKHVLTSDEEKTQEAWQRKRDKEIRSRNWSVSFDRPSFPEWDYHPTGKLAIEFEHFYTLSGPSIRRSFRDAKTQRLEIMAGDIAVGLAVLAAAKSEDRRQREEAARQEEERRQQRERAERRRYVQNRRVTALSEISTELVELDRLRQLLTGLRQVLGDSATNRVGEFIRWADNHLALREAALTPGSLEERFATEHLFADDDDIEFRPLRRGY